MEDRQSLNPGRIKLTFDDGTVRYATMERADGPIVAGTPLNKATLFDEDNSIRYGAETVNGGLSMLGKVWPAVTLKANGWDSVGADGYNVQEVSVEGMLAQYYPSMVPVYSSATMKDDEKVALSMVDIVETVDGGIVAKATYPPDVDVSFIMLGV